jgi:hypothetical protein
LVYNNKQIQTLFSEYCGYYCLLFLLFISKNNNLTNFVKLFKKPYYNDQMIKNYLEKILKFYFKKLIKKKGIAQKNKKLLNYF